MQIKPYEKNAKEHNKKQVELIARSISRFGWQQPIKVGKDSVILAGHGRWQAYNEYKDTLDMKTPWIIDEDGKTISGEAETRRLTEDEEKAYRLADNQINALTGNDMKLVVEELKILPEDLLDLTGFEKDLIIEPDEKDDEVPETPEEPKSKMGDLYELGRHKVLCGDSIVMDDMTRLMGSFKANMAFTDPPYLMGFTGNVHGDGSKSHNAKFGAIKNDKMSVEDGKQFIGDIVRNIKAFVSGAYYICFYRLGVHYVLDALLENGMEYKAVIIWDKGNHTLSNSDYMSKYEPIIYGWNEEHKFYGGRSNFDIWEVARTSKNELHPTMKPVALCEKAIINSSEQNGIVMDIFLGSGSTLIASQKTGRICYGMELDPKYVDVIVQRYVDYTGNENIKLNGKDIVWKKTQKN